MRLFKRGQDVDTMDSKYSFYIIIESEYFAVNEILITAKSIIY